jgi:hypothetical protein
MTLEHKTLLLIDCIVNIILGVTLCANISETPTP